MFDGVRTLYRLTRGEKIAEDQPTPHTVIAEGHHRTLRRYGSDDQLTAAQAAGGTPVLLLPPLAVPARCYDLSPETSLVAFLLSTGRIPYVVDFGEMDYSDRHLGFTEFFDDIVPEAIGRVLDDFSAGDVDLIAWSLGGTVSFLTAAAHPDLPIRTITALGTPLDYAQITPYPLVRQVMRPVAGKPVTLALKAFGGIPAPLVRVAYRAMAWERELRKPGYIMRNADDREALARMQVIDWFQDSLPGYPGKVAEEMWEVLIFRDELAKGLLHFGDRTLDLTTITAPIQLFGSHRDAIVSWAAAHHGVDLFSGSDHIHFTTVETSHLGLIAGSDAAEKSWPRIAAFLDAPTADPAA